MDVPFRRATAILVPSAATTIAESALRASVRERVASVTTTAESSHPASVQGVISIAMITVARPRPAYAGRYAPSITGVRLIQVSSGTSNTQLATIDREAASR